jgi:hypothetical protein
MARVVQRRSTPPYLLIVFVLLFLLAFGAAIKLYMDASDARKQLARVSEQNRSLLSPDDDVQDLIEKYRSAPRGKIAPTVVSQLRNQVSQLAEVIAGPEKSYAIALEEANGIPKLLETEMQPPLVVEIRRLKSQRDQKIQDTITLDEMLNEKDKQLAAEKAEKEQLSANLGKELSALQQKIDSLEKQIQAEQSDHLQLREKAQQDADARADDLNKKVADLSGQIQQLENDKLELGSQLATKDAEIERLRVELGRGKQGGNIRPTATVIGEPSRDGYLYINIGRGSGVKTGLTFSVYPNGLITNKTPSKGKLTVTSVRDNISECRITQSDPNAPITRGDQVVNIVFSDDRTYTFVVEGQFDLHGTGKPNAAGTAEVRMLVDRYGGTVGGEVDVQTDYVVLGTPVPKPLQPPRDAPAANQQIYREQLAIYDRYYEVKQRAIELKIPVLNANRFMDYIGMLPARGLEYR